MSTQQEVCAGVPVVDLLFVRVSPEQYEATEDSTTTGMFARVLNMDLTATTLVGPDDEDGASLRCNHLGENAWPRLKARIQRYIRRRDGYTALLSLLLKSQAYYQAPGNAAPEENSGNTSARPIVDLPRTSHNKPFIPKRQQMNGLSISHQAPFIGMARLGALAEKSQGIGMASSSSPEGSHPSTNRSHLSVGLDIVVFEPLNTKLYSCTDDFLKVFQSSFTEAEWLQLIGTPDRLREFYIRWSMKEAYTKALGLGMGYPFDQFQIDLDCTANLKNDNGIWSWTGIQRDNGTYAVSHGTVQRKDRKVKEDDTGRLIAETERWVFLFRQLPLPTESSTVIGCACTCVGPLDDGQGNPKHGESGVEIQDSWTTTEELFQFHGIEVDGNDR